MLPAIAQYWEWILARKEILWTQHRRLRKKEQQALLEFFSLSKNFSLSGYKTEISIKYFLQHAAFVANMLLLYF